MPVGHAAPSPALLTDTFEGPMPVLDERSGATVQTVTAQAKNRIRIAPGRARRKAIDRFTLDGDPDRRDAFLNQIKGRPLAIDTFSSQSGGAQGLGVGGLSHKGR